MGGKALSSSMGDTLTVHNDEVRINAEGLEGRQQTRYLPKGEEAGNVGECDLCTAYAVIEDFEIRKMSRQLLRRLRRSLAFGGTFPAGQRHRICQYTFRTEFLRSVLGNGRSALRALGCS